MSEALQLFGAGREKRIYAVPPYTEVVSLDFEDHPFEVQKFDKPCALCGAENVYLDEVVLDDRGGRMFVCSDTDNCESRRAEGCVGVQDLPGSRRPSSPAGTSPRKNVVRTGRRRTAVVAAPSRVSPCDTTPPTP
jgi:alpha-D-ribose 1-methylphosphonate 5-phosphate C-P lyase